MADDKSHETVSHADIATAIQQATQEVFSTMLNLEIRAGDDGVSSENSAEPSSGVVSLIGLAGSWVGTGSLVCSSPFACEMSAHFLLSEFDTVNEEVLDAVAEITNMIIGNVKTMLEARLGSMGLSVPTVIHGRDFQT